MDDRYQPSIPVPGARVGAQVGAAWRRLFAGWRPEPRTLGALLVATFLGILASRLLVADLTWSSFTASLQPQPPFRAIPWQQAVGTTTQMLGVPADAVVLLGGLGLVLRRRWGLAVALTGLASVMAIAMVNAVVYLSRAPFVRSGIGEVLYALGTALPVAVLLWARSPGEEG